MCSSKYGTGVLCVLLIFCFCHGTEVRESSNVLDTSIEYLMLPLPVLVCHSKHDNYRAVLWYKDDLLLRKGGSATGDHVMSLADLLQQGHLAGVFSNPLELQGYYWCETDNMNHTQAYKFLFKLKEVNTYVGKILLSRDSLGDTEELTVEKMNLKKFVYQKEMQEKLFPFLPKPSVYVNELRPLQGGVEVQFYLYTRQTFHPRQRFASDLVRDQQELAYVLDYLNNKTDATEEETHGEIAAWIDTHGMSLQDIELRSTLGCYIDETMIPGDPPKELTWPNAYIGDVVIPNEGCSSKSGLAVTRVCTGSFYRGGRWGNPSGKCDMPDAPLTAEIRRLYQRYGEIPRPLYISNLKKLTDASSELTVTDLHLVLDILLEISHVSRLSTEDVDNAFSVLDNLFETNATELEAAKLTIYLTTRILEVVQNLLNRATQKNREILIAKRHLLIETKSTKLGGREDAEGEGDHIYGVAVLSPNGTSLEDAGVRFLTNSSEVLLSSDEDVASYFLLPPELVLSRETALSSRSQLIWS